MRSDRKTSLVYLGLSVALALAVAAGMAFSPPPGALERMKEKAWLKEHPAPPPPPASIKKVWPPPNAKHARIADNTKYTSSSLTLEVVAPSPTPVNSALSTPVPKP